VAHRFGAIRTRAATPGRARRARPRRHTLPPPPPPPSFNELEYRWVALDTWNFTRKFDVPADLLTHTNVRQRGGGVRGKY